MPAVQGAKHCLSGPEPAEVEKPGPVRKPASAGHRCALRYKRSRVWVMAAQAMAAGFRSGAAPGFSAAAQVVVAGIGPFHGLGPVRGTRRTDSGLLFGRTTRFPSTEEDVLAANGRNVHTGDQRARSYETRHLFLLLPSQIVVAEIEI